MIRIVTGGPTSDTVGARPVEFITIGRTLAGFSENPLPSTPKAPTFAIAARPEIFLSPLAIITVHFNNHAALSTPEVTSAKKA
jgi:hypothetical protein